MFTTNCYSCELAFISVSSGSLLSAQRLESANHSTTHGWEDSLVSGGDDDARLTFKRNKSKIQDTLRLVAVSSIGLCELEVICISYLVITVRYGLT